MHAITYIFLNNFLGHEYYRKYINKQVYMKNKHNFLFSEIWHLIKSSWKKNRKIVMNLK